MRRNIAAAYGWLPSGCVVLAERGKVNYSKRYRKPVAKAVHNEGIVSWLGESTYTIFPVANLERFI